jgi:hypothetical protein
MCYPTPGASFEREALPDAAAGMNSSTPGAVRCSVPHRNAAHAFQVVTPDVTVVDLGTVFTVSLTAQATPRGFSVEEGQVLVRDASGERTVQAPNRWSNHPPRRPDAESGAHP